MTARRRTTVLLVVEDVNARARYVDALLAAGYMVHAVASPGEAEPAARTTRFDLAIVDSALDEPGLTVAERLGALRRRPRLIAVTTRPRDGAPLEWLFDVYLVKPCAPWDLVEAVRSVQIPRDGTQDLLIISRDRVGIFDVLQRFGGTTAGLDVRLDLRRGQRRHAPRRSRGSQGIVERRRAERRALDVSAQLDADGYAYVAAVDRS